MKKYLIIFALIFNGITFAQTVQSTCSLNDTIAPKYRKDAYRFAIRRCIDKSLPYKDSIQVDKSLSDFYLKELIAVYNATAIPARDTIFKICNLHTRADPDMNFFTISADSNLTWMKNIRNNISPTGNVPLDKAIQRFNLQKYQFDSSTPWIYHTADFKTDSNINLNALSPQIFTMQGIGACSPLGGAIDGPDIFDSIATNFTQFLFAYKWQDCFDGCDKSRWWKFRVYNDCSVSYFGSYGYSLPVGVGIKENTLSLSRIKIYPNPATDKITIETDSPEPNTKLFISDVSGRKVKELENLTGLQTVDLNDLAAGIYFLNIKATNSQKTFKFIKACL